MSLPPFEHLLEQFRAPVYRYLVAIAGPTEADDCFQETFIAALRAYPRLNPSSNVKAWLFTIAHRKAIDSIRATSRRPVPAEIAEQNGHLADPVETSEIWSAVRRLPPKQSQAVLHRHLAGLPYREIAEVMGTTEEAARRNVHEGLKRLRKIIESPATKEMIRP